MAAWVKDALLRNRKPILDLTLDWRCLTWVWMESLQSNQTHRYFLLRRLAIWSLYLQARVRVCDDESISFGLHLKVCSHRQTSATETWHYWNRVEAICLHEESYRI
jgi:hypothetical protein